MIVENQPTIQLGSGDIRPLRTGDTTPAIEALMNATRSGALDFETINSHFAKGAKQAAAIDAMGTASVEDRNKRELLPQIQALKKKTLELESQIAPVKGEVERKKLEAESRNLDFSQQVEPTEKDLKVRSLLNAQALAQAEEEARVADDNGQSLRVFQSYTATGKPPIRTDGKLDFIKMAQSSPETKEFSKLREAAALHGVTPTNADGSEKNESQLLTEIATASTKPKELTPAQRAEEIANVNTAEQTLKRLSDVSGVLFETDATGNVIRNPDGTPKTKGAGVVGPITGSAPGKLFRRATSLFGDTTYDKQRQVEMLHNEIVRELTSALKGPLSEKELAFLKKSVPDVNDTEAVWDNYLKDYIPNMTSAVTRRKQALMLAPAQTAAPAVTPPASTVPNARATPASADYTARVAKALPWGGTGWWRTLTPGTDYLDRAGNLHTKQ